MPLSQQNFSVSVHLLDKNQTRFEACQQTLCYFQDDLWLNPYMDTLYTLACRYPQQWIANTRLVDYIDYMTWRFKQGELSTGYADLRYGAFVSKNQIERFLANDALDHTSDVHFSIGSNQFPYIIANPLYEEYERQDVRQDVYDALAVVVKGQVEKKEEVVMDVKSSCANDQCLFMTNMDMMPPPLLLDTISNYEIEYKQRYHLPAKNTIIYHSYHKAVDQDTETCWYSYQCKFKITTDTID
ncbi:hypothetical protein G6F66_002981 [Rhizopus arrhizus]|nr:hypothetical protein G6F66_002981 [Rhizopus arrhizus]